MIFNAGPSVPRILTETFFERFMPDREYLVLHGTDRNPGRF